MAGNRTRRELGKYWKLISQDSMDAAAYDEAQRWLAEHPDEVKELDNLIASSDRKSRRHRADQTVEQTEYRCRRRYSDRAIPDAVAAEYAAQAAPPLGIPERRQEEMIAAKPCVKCVA